MKMPEEHPLVAVSRQEQGIGAILAVKNGVPRGRYNGGAFTKTAIDATMYAPLSPSSS